jgi:hypothetical protein
MHKWSPIFTLPNVCIKTPFENDYLAIVSPEDERCVEINSRHPTFIPFLDRFSDTFRRKVTPSILALQLPCCFEVRALGGGLVSSAPE